VLVNRGFSITNDKHENARLFELFLSIGSKRDLKVRLIEG